ncbi:uncharacterized protein CcaverHIS019_0502530 [Cutaneotrichosporon cavernicola]|uniref:MFS general substrate transporter n=1 Tax=Cutaneotrichosporon cavernicola TaxID=279322 RepID=A0AA48QWR0_9TREE|nr:uncharacterized protein CcaverHIS019_0502530 [Cutaneotrichosporon cavernicola]BEI92625.1 hypothetical protein CcaverHIS019_0502530 [Cutaneotrichosporon cavernicola]
MSFSHTSRDRKGSHVSEKLGTITVEVADTELDKLDEYEEVIAAEAEFTEAEYKRLLRKIDLDKTSLSSGVIFGLKEDTHLTSQEYNNLNSFFYMSYGVAQIPMGWVMQRFPLGKALSVCVILWGAMVMLLGACNHYWDLSIVRVLLGWFESVVTPGFVVLTSSWYLRREQTLRQACYYAMNTFFSIVFGIAIYGIADNAHRKGGMAAWRVINLFLGGVTVGIGIILLFIIGTPNEVWWLSKREKLMAKARIVQNATGGGEQHPWKWSQVKECLRDPQYWFACAYNLLSCIPNGGLGAFNNLIYKSMGFTNLQVILYCVGNIVGTQIFVPSDAPKYLKGLISCGAVMCLNAINLACWWMYYTRTNARREAQFLALGITEETRAHESRLAGELDLTDRENTHFRYAC